jgi:uncharacterized protein (TIGR04255 family)
MAGKHLQNAPIIEAALDIRVRIPENVTIETLQKLHDRVRDRYPEQSKRMDVEAHIRSQAPFETIEEASFQAKSIGFFFWSADKKQAIQARLDGFTFSRLKDYENWESLREEASNLWRVYVDVVQPVSIQRVALRYINRMEFPLPCDFDDYLNTFPRLGSACPQTISGLFLRLVTQHGLGTVVISEAIDEKRVTESKVPVILDIDAFRTVNFPISEDVQAWSILEELRNLKNDVFFSSITPKAEALFS